MKMTPVTTASVATRITTTTATILSLALMTASAYAAEPKVDFYGSVRIALDKKEEAMSSEDELSRIGVKASKELDNGLTAVAQVEYEIGYDQKAPLELRLGYLGLKGSFGEIYHGSQTTVWHKFVRGAYFSDGADSLRMYTIRDDGLTQYYYKNGGFTFGAGVQTEDKDGNNVDTIQAGAEYKMGAFKGQIAYVQDKNNAGRNGDKDAGLLGARVWYNKDGLTLSAFTHRADKNFDYKTSNICAGEDTSTNGVYGGYKTGAHLVHARYAVNSCDGQDRESIKAEYVHYLDKAFQVWASFEQLDDANGSSTSSDYMQLGARFDF
ncbi:porin [Oceanobacter mangrovi]|uniref:porin n=1 Tax=Oceanobacter mangrovi TaxID=2862510 RepID=UPI001C8EB458|nr:porin [Oceanobacter mangrovi]